MFVFIVFLIIFLAEQIKIDEEKLKPVPPYNGFSDIKGYKFSLWPHYLDLLTFSDLNTLWYNDSDA